MTPGIDHTGTWTPQQYIIDAGWPMDAVTATARLGISAEDAEGLTAEQQARLLAHCRDRSQQLTLVFHDSGTAARMVIDGSTREDAERWLRENQTEPCERIEWGVNGADGSVLWMGDL